MRATLPVSRNVRFFGSIFVWVAAVVTAYWLYRDGAGGGDIVAVAQIKEYKVSPASLGRLVSLHVTEGQRVSDGQLLAKFDTSLMEREMSVAQVRREFASSEVRATGVSLDVNSLQNERMFEREIDAIDVDLQTARSESTRNLSELHKVVEDTERQQDLVSRGLTTSGRLTELELQRTALEGSAKEWPTRIAGIEARRKMAVTRLEELRQARLANHNNGNAAQLQPSRDKVRQEAESIRMLQTQMDASVLRAGGDAYVSLIQARPGDVLKPGDPVMVLVEAQPRRAVAYLEERAGNSLPIGTEVRVRRRVGDRHEFTANVVSVAGDVSAIPERVASNPHLASWGRAMYIALPDHSQIDPGEALDVRLKTGRDGPPNRLHASN